MRIRPLRYYWLDWITILLLTLCHFRWPCTAYSEAYRSLCLYVDLVQGKMVVCGTFPIARFLETLRAEIVQYTPPESLKMKQANILLVGQVGAGKSSFFNTITSIYRGHVTLQAVTGSSQRSLTTQVYCRTHCSLKLYRAIPYISFKIGN